MPPLPTGTVTFFFSDIEGSTRLLGKLGRDVFGPLQDQHADVLRASIAESDGVEIRTEGDAFFAVFPTAAGALSAAVRSQRDLAERPWPDEAPIRVRIGLHTGEGVLGGDDYLGLDVNKAARIAASGHGGQTVVSSTTAALVGHDLPEGVALRDLGTHALKDFEQPEHLNDLVIDGLDMSFPPLRTADPRRTVLPSFRTSFVGRKHALTELAASVMSNRLTTLTGPGGTGKTRLAVEVATSLAHRFGDGVYFVDLSSVTEPGVVAAEIASVIRLRDSAIDATTALRDHLRDRRLLLVLDNMEQLVAGAGVVGDLLDAAPDLTVLATSRIPLRLAGEATYPVPPLSLPEGTGGATTDDLEALTAVESIRLFCDRAAEARPGFRLDATNAPAIVEIVSRLDALPLAIELAVARLRVLDPVTLADRLERRLPMLTGGPRDAPERHRTLMASIRWSEESLDDGARRLFRDLSVFACGWTLEAAEAVCDSDLNVLDGLTTLVETSLVRRSGDDAAELRFSMLETIREYAAELLAHADADERALLHRRHAAYFRALAEESEPHITGERQLEWLARLEREHDNIRAMLDRAERGGAPNDVGEALFTAGAIWRFWQQRGHLSEGRARVRRLLALPAAATRDAARVRALGALGAMDYWKSDYPTMLGRYEEAVEIARELGDRRLLSHALFDLSFEWFLTGDIQDAVTRLEEGLAVAEPDDDLLRAKASLFIGYGHYFTGDLSAAREPVERAIEILRTTEERFALCEAIVSMAALKWLTGKHDEATADLAEATELVLDAPTPLLLAQIVLPHQLKAIYEKRFRRAAILQGAWDALVEEFEVNFPDVGKEFFGDTVGPAREALGEAGFADAWAIGRAMDQEEMLDLLTGAAPHD